jgi:hypothetical protein
MSWMATTTHTMVVELSHEVVVSFMRWLFHEATTSFALLALSPHIIKNHMWHCMRQPMRLLTCTNVFTLIILVPQAYQHKNTILFNKKQNLNDLLKKN